MWNFVLKCAPRDIGKKIGEHKLSKEIKIKKKRMKNGEKWADVETGALIAPIGVAQPIVTL